MKDELRKEIEKLQERYSSLADDICVEKAEGSLDKLYNLREETDRTFDIFFDSEDIRKKYNDYYDVENECSLFDKSNKELVNEFDEKDLKDYAEFLQSCIKDKKEELRNLRLSRRNTEEDSDLQRLQSLECEEFNVDDIMSEMLDSEEMVIINKITGHTSHFEGHGECQLYNAYYDAFNSPIYNIWVDDNNIIVEIK